MKTAYIDCFSGVSGDMLLGALLDVGIPLEELKKGLNLLNLSGYEIKHATVSKKGIRASRVEVMAEEKQPPRHLKDIENIIKESFLPERVKETSIRVFSKLAEAEAKVHGISVSKVHFHEVGAVDALVDVVGSVYGFYYLNAEKIIASPLPLGGGTVKCQHGLLPVPAPATLELVKGVPLRESPGEGELVTPTGAALVTTLAENFGPIPTMKIMNCGYGAGKRDLPHPNVLRIILGKTVKDSLNEEWEQETIGIIEANIDDMNPEFYTYLEKLIFKEGGLDFYITPVFMKKNRPGTKLTVLSPPNRMEALSRLILRETSTFGCRMRTEKRYKARWSVLKIKTPYGHVDVKYSPETGTLSPEYAHCEELAIKTGVPLKIIYDSAKAEAVKFLKKPGNKL
ncbi:MAG: nickel pincer cofactor biosynthesis protein LarC [Clostridia bacterium]|nr:nickel pincer cofactor biosynthesis protein LarC [Clostridia bacterium]